MLGKDLIPWKPTNNPWKGDQSLLLFFCLHVIKSSHLGAMKYPVFDFIKAILTQIPPSEPGMLPCCDLWSQLCSLTWGGVGCRVISCSHYMITAFFFIKKEQFYWAVKYFSIVLREPINENRVVGDQWDYWRGLSHRISFSVCLFTVAETFCKTKWKQLETKSGSGVSIVGNATTT